MVRVPPPDCGRAVSGQGHMSAPLLRFLGYHGRDVWIAPARVLYVRDGGLGSRGVATDVQFDTGDTVSLNARAEDVQRRISEALEAPTVRENPAGT